MSDNSKTKASEDTLNELHEAVAQKLLDRIKSGEATAADFQAAAKFLKDNGVEGAAAPGTPLGDLSESLPQLEEAQQDGSWH